MAKVSPLTGHLAHVPTTRAVIQGARIDNLHFLAEHNIDRNQVAKQLQEIFCRMIYITGFFHADGHGGEQERSA